MGIFSLFGKKERPPAATSAARASVRSKPDDQARVGDDAQRDQIALDQREAARATALKIDAIESEMSSEFVRPATARQPTALLRAGQPAAIIDVTPNDLADPADAGNDSLLDDTIFDASATEASVEDVPLFEEAAILFANGQTAMVEHLLQDAIENDALGNATITAWAMLFDLYQITADQARFEHLSIAYASKFETSPPAWLPLAPPDAASASLARAAAMPSVMFTATLDDTIVKSLEKARTLAEKNPALRLEFTRINAVDPVGCSLLLQVLKQLRKSGINLVLVGGPELVIHIKAILAVGRRDETEAPWLLLLELLEMMNLESAFEEASIDYCVTFEVSPPAFAAPQNKISTAIEEPGPSGVAADVFIMPALIEGRTDSLVAALGEFALQHNPACIDCAALARVDVNAAAQLLTGITPLTGDGRTIDFINVNHLVAALFNVIGLKEVVHIHTRRI